MVCPLGIKSKGSLLVVGVAMVVTTGLVADGSSKISLSLIGALLTPVTLGSGSVALIEAIKLESKSVTVESVTVILALTGVTELIVTLGKSIGLVTFDFVTLIDAVTGVTDSIMTSGKSISLMVTFDSGVTVSVTLGFGERANGSSVLFGHVTQIAQF